MSDPSAASGYACCPTSPLAASVATKSSIRGPAVRVSIYKLHGLRSPLLDHRGIALRPAGDSNGTVSAVRGLYRRVPGTGRPPLSRTGEHLYRLWSPNRPLGPGRASGRRAKQAVAHAAELLRSGQLLALKGLGGFQLVCRADDAEAVRRLRNRKHRPSKPFAVMVNSLDDAARIASLGPAEMDLLTSPANPIVLAEQRTGTEGIATGEVAPQLLTIGLFLPTTPLHRLLLASVNRPLVVTSGNRSDEPIVTDEREAPRQLAGIADAFLVHDRPILRRVDDSVVRVIAGRPTALRLARGYAPLPLPALERFPDTPPLLAVSGHQKVALAIWTGQQAVLTQHIGDMTPRNHGRHSPLPLPTCATCTVFNRPRSPATCTLISSRLVRHSWKAGHRDTTSPRTRCRLHGRARFARPRGSGVGVDGTGYGRTARFGAGKRCATAENYRRVASLLPFPLPGGESAIRRPNRIAFSLLVAGFGRDYACDPRRCKCWAWRPRKPACSRHSAQGPPVHVDLQHGAMFDAVAACARHQTVS